MIPIQQHGKRWLILTLTLSTSVLALASIGTSQPVVFADENSHLQSPKNTNKIEVLNWEAFSKKLKDYSSDQRQFHVLKLGFENRLGTLSTREELEEFGKNNNFLVINGKVTQNIHDFPHILVMNKGDVIAHNEEDYHNQMRELRFSGNGDLHNSMEPKRIHALFKIELDSNKRQLLNAAGLGTAENSLKNINGMTIYSHGLTVDNKYYEDYSKYTHNSVKNINVTKERFIANDDLIHKLIESSEAMKQSSERDKVKAFVQYVANHTTYDWEAANKAVQNYADINYYLGSDLFAVTERQKAMCVGFSTTAARAFNMLGLPAYVVVGKNAEGVPHATARVYYDKKWHTIDGTGFITGNKHQRSAKYSEKHFSTIGEDSYDVVEAGQEPKAERNYMIIDSNYESWAMKQKTADLLLFNKEKSLVGLDYIAYVEPSSKESSEAQVNTVSSPQVSSASPTSSETISTDTVTASQEKAESRVSAPQVISASQTSPETNSAEVVTTSQEVAKAPVSAPQVSSEIQTLSETAPTEVATEAPELSALESNPAPQTSLETTPTEEVTETPEPSVVESNSASPTSPETNSAEAVTTSQEMAEPSVSVPQVSSEIPTSSETAPAEVATEVSEESSSASQPSPETTPTETVTTSQEVAEAPVSAPQVSSEIPTSPETASTEVVVAKQEVADSPVSAPQVISEIPTSSETAPAEVATEVTEPSVVASSSASPTSPEANSTEVVVAKQEVADPLVSAPQTSSASLTLEVPKNEHLDEKADATTPNGVEANTHEAVSVPTSDIRVQDAGSDTVPQPYSLSATLFEEAISTVEPVGVATSSQERSAVAGKVKVPTSLERSNNSVEEEKVVDSNATIENREPEKKEILTSENVLNSLVTIWVALSTSFFMRYFSRGK
ncbi:transglutaminase domain-containing protein [Streptococcus suis]|uniref:transglutaminase domain-containing protein n=1 Tax=Streptococcus suis TaxID=1307 RepID=UPI003A4DB50C